MQWVKASERMPKLEDKTSVDSYGDVVFRIVDGPACVGTCRAWDMEVKHEWLEGWNVQHDPVRYVVQKTSLDGLLFAPHTTVGKTASEALIEAATWYGPGKYQVDDGRTKQVFTVESEVVYRVTDLRGGDL